MAHSPAFSLLPPPLLLLCLFLGPVRAVPVKLHHITAGDDFPVPPPLLWAPSAEDGKIKVRRDAVSDQVLAQCEKECASWQIINATPESIERCKANCRERLVGGH